MSFFSPRIAATFTLLTAVLSQFSCTTVPSKPHPVDDVIILAYHEITDEKSLIPSYSMSTTGFKSHVQWLKEQGFHFISVQQFLDAKQGRGHLPSKPVLITVDDGYQSFYQHVYPFIQQEKVPVLLAVVGSWLSPHQDQAVNFSGQNISRDKMLSWAELKDMQNSGWVEIGSHSYALHQGILANPQGNEEPAAVVRRYDAGLKKYENDQQYEQRIYQDLKKNNELISQNGLKTPRVMVWPYGRYNQQTIAIAQQLGMPMTLSLDDGADRADTPMSQLSRILVPKNMSTEALANEIQQRHDNLGDQARPQKIMHVDLDYIYDPDTKQQERNLDHLLERIVKMQVNTVFLQAFADPDANGSADMVYFPNRHLPMRADLFNRVAWQIQTRTQVKRVYAWMPLMAWELPKQHAAAKELVHTEQAEKSAHLNMGYHRLSLFSPLARQTIREIYQDLAKSTPFNGLLFHDDATLSDFEDVSPQAVKAYQAQGLSQSFAEIRQNDQQLQKWTAYKTRAIDDFSLELASEVRQYQPFLMTARNLYAQVALSAYAENWYAQSLEESLNRYDFTAIMAMPYMEQVDDSKTFYLDMVKRVASYPHGFDKTIFELQAVDWRTGKKVSSEEMVDTIELLYQNGVKHVGYYPDDPIADHPNPTMLKKVFAQK